MRDLTAEPIDVSFIFENLSGVYLLCQDETIVYIGKSKNVVARILQHKEIYRQFRLGKRVGLNGPKNTFKPIKFNRVLFVPEENDLERAEIEHMLVQKHMPKYNERLKGFGISPHERRGGFPQKSSESLLKLLNLGNKP